MVIDGATLEFALSIKYFFALSSLGFCFGQPRAQRAAELASDCGSNGWSWQSCARL
jgi:hypothetical protein